MKHFKKTTLRNLKNNNGFTIIELMIVIAILGILASMAYGSFSPMKNRANDTIAKSDIRNFAEAVVDIALANEDVDFTAVDANGGIGSQDNSGNPRTPVFVLSPGVAIVPGTLSGSTQEPKPGGDATIVQVELYHVNGTPGKTFICTIDETSGLVSLPK